MIQVGGIKEKVLAAHWAGISHVIVPQRNEKDLKELPKGVKVNKPMFDYQLHRLARGTGSEERQWWENV